MTLYRYNGRWWRYVEDDGQTVEVRFCSTGNVKTFPAGYWARQATEVTKAGVRRLINGWYREMDERTRVIQMLGRQRLEASNLQQQLREDDSIVRLGNFITSYSEEIARHERHNEDLLAEIRRAKEALNS